MRFSLSLSTFDDLAAMNNNLSSAQLSSMDLQNPAKLVQQGNWPANDDALSSHDEGKTSLASLYNQVTDIDQNIDAFLKGLLTWDSEELEGLGAINLFQKRLQIKPIVFEIFSVTDFPDIQPMDLKSLRDKDFSNMNNLLKEIDIKTPLRWNVGYAEKQLASPTPPTSPFVLLPTLHKYISRSKPLVDPFSAHEIDHESTKKYSPTHMVNHEVNIVGSNKPSDEPGAPIIEDVIAAGEINKILDTSRKLSEQLNSSLVEDKIAVSETCSVDDPIRNRISTPQKSMVDNSMEPEFNANVDSNEPPVNIELHIGGNGMGKRVMDGRQNVEPNEPYQFEDKMLAENMQEITASIPTDDSNLNLVIPLADQSNPDVHEAYSMNKRSRRSDDGPEQCLQEKTIGSVASVKGQKRVKICAQKESKGKRLQLRKSLADAGTSWESGVRRSRRFKTRPLEYWKGERMVYGRVYESLSSVIGVKRLAQGSSDGKQTMQVKSFVSGKYREFFEIAFLY